MEWELILKCLSYNIYSCNWNGISDILISLLPTGITPMGIGSLRRTSKNNKCETPDTPPIRHISSRNWFGITITLCVCCETLFYWMVTLLQLLSRQEILHGLIDLFILLHEGPVSSGGDVGHTQARDMLLGQLRHGLVKSHVLFAPNYMWWNLKENYDQLCQLLLQDVAMGVRLDTISPDLPRPESLWRHHNAKIRQFSCSTAANQPEATLEKPW